MSGILSNLTKGGSLGAGAGGLIARTVVEDKLDEDESFPRIFGAILGASTTKQIVENLKISNIVKSLLVGSGGAIGASLLSEQITNDDFTVESLIIGTGGTLGDIFFDKGINFKL